MGTKVNNVKKFFLFCPPSGGRKRWAGFNPQNPLDFAQNGFGFRPTKPPKLNFSNPKKVHNTPENNVEQR